MVAIRGTGQILLAVVGGLLAAWAVVRWILRSPATSGPPDHGRHRLTVRVRTGVDPPGRGPDSTRSIPVSPQYRSAIPSMAAPSTDKENAVSNHRHTALRERRYGKIAVAGLLTASVGLLATAGVYAGLSATATGAESVTSGTFNLTLTPDVGSPDSRNFTPADGPRATPTTSTST